MIGKQTISTETDTLWHVCGALLLEHVYSVSLHTHNPSPHPISTPHRHATIIVKKSVAIGVTTGVPSTSLMSCALFCGLLIAMVLLILGAIYCITPSRPRTRARALPNPSSNKSQHRIRPHSASLHIPTSHRPNKRSTNVLASYTESRSVSDDTSDTNVAATPFRQTTNHQPFSTQARVPSRATAKPTAQPRVNLWDSSLCGVYV